MSKKGWDIMLDEIYDENEIKRICERTKGAEYSTSDRTIRFTGSQEKQNELCRAIKRFARIWGTILLWTVGAG